MAGNNERIRELVARYFTAVDTKNLDELMELFSEDAVATDFSGSVHKGKDAIKKLWEWGFKTMPNMKHAPGLAHYPGGLLIKVIGKEATAKCRWMFSANGKEITMWGRTEFHLRLEKDAWKIVDLKIISD